MPRVRLLADTFLALGEHPIERRKNSDGKTFTQIPVPHGRIYEAGDEVDLPDKHPDGKPFIVNDEAWCESEGRSPLEATMERIDPAPPVAARTPVRR